MPTISYSVNKLNDLFEMMKDVPNDWVGGGKKKKKQGHGNELALIPCEEYRTVVNSWRKALRWTDGLDCALSVMLASITSVKTVGDQLWVKIIGPASTGKSTLCEAVSCNTKYIMAKSTIRGFHSGYGDESEDNSLVARLSGKTLVTKDGDTLLQSPNLGQILAEARDLYDCTSRTHYRNKQSKDYSGVRMTWILSGTSSLRSIDSSELGERFLDCVIMEEIDDDMEDEILWRVANRADRGVGIESNSKAETHNDPKLTEAMQLTGGYVDHLRDNAINLLSAIDNPEQSRRACTRLGKFVAYMRARPSKLQTEHAEREFAARLVVQMVRLSKCLAAVLNRSSVDEEVMRRVRKVALDTARGQTLKICQAIYDNGSLTPKSVQVKTNIESGKVSELLTFLKGIGVLEVECVKNKTYWGLRRNARSLLDDVLQEE